MTKPDASTAIPNPPPKQRARVNKQRTHSDNAVEAQLKLPNERDESISMTPDLPDPMIKQAAKDVANGLQDTSRSAETDRAYKKLRK